MLHCLSWILSICFNYFESKYIRSIGRSVGRALPASNSLRKALSLTETAQVEHNNAASSKNALVLQLSVVLFRKVDSDSDAPQQSLLQATRPQHELRWVAVLRTQTFGGGVLASKGVSNSFGCSKKQPTPAAAVSALPPSIP